MKDSLKYCKVGESPATGKPTSNWKKREMSNPRQSIGAPTGRSLAVQYQFQAEFVFMAILRHFLSWFLTPFNQWISSRL